MIDFSIFLGGKNRIVLPFLLYPLLFVAPSLILSSIIIIPNDRLPGFLKQLLSIPLLLAVFFIPFGFTNGNRIIDLVAGVTNYNIFLRFLELYWVGPLIQDRPVYATPLSLWIDFWSSLRTFPKKGKPVKIYKKDKKFYHIILNFLICAFILDIFGSWICSFTGYEAVAMIKEKPITYFFFFAACIVVMTAGFNLAGYILQFMYCVFVEHGSYSSEQWNSLMRHPIVSHSLDDLWSYRWHQLFKTTWLAFPFRPVRILTQRALAKRVSNDTSRSVAFLLASISVFFASAFMHEYIVAANLGWPIFNRYFKGQQCIFFISHGVGAFFENLIKLYVAPRLSPQFKNSLACRVIQHTWTILFGYFTFYYIMNGFLSWGFHFDNPCQLTKPFVAKFVYAHPRLHSYFGSQI
ncbi:uncharacterized protein BX663DRAFT_497151 [Cokeromyces recurvatus]|uniref:uncharacterized protein n=1 Tax=Cokeromyces recurvatus TaxID=90255 RepID=UPI0022200EDC|nr:uncharacterized protein BX663DRAFT_497151 [Cokeromyces recurvatus]KAI7906631.1 hypothetical protein BX663DRAFT_497151 [Cokeromyces recurvatus]